MSRLAPGENEKIDKINQLVAGSRGQDTLVKEDGLRVLLEMFHPLILKLCKKWSLYFRDDKHTIIPFDILISDARMWFIEYTLNKYDIDGSATYNKFIKDHLDQRIRYIYECELKYFKRHIFPDPDRNQHSIDNDSTPMLEHVIYSYTTPDDSDSIENQLIEKQDANNRMVLAHAILHLLYDRRYFNQREHDIFMGCCMNGITHEAMGRKLGISRTRVSQILIKTKQKINTMISNNRGTRRLAYKCL